MSTWAVAGAAFTPEDARAVAHNATSGARGVAGPADLKVTALPVAGPFVRIAPGGATLPSLYPGAAGQSYTTRQAAAEDLAVPATTSAGAAVRYVIQRITDPQYEGQAPADPVNHRYDTFALVNSLAGIAYPYVELARINQPASTTNITQAMITDQRKLAVPREERQIVLGAPVAGQNLTSAAFVRFPATDTLIDIPAWATELFCTYTISAAALHDGGAGSGVEGYFHVGLGGSGSPDANFTMAPDIFYSFDAPAGGFPNRQVVIVGAKIPVPVNLRGTQGAVRLFGNRTVGAGYLATAAGTQTIADLQFYERVG